MCGKKFSIYGVHIPRKCIESMHFHSCPSSPPKTPRRDFLKTCYPHDERGGRNYDYLLY